MSRSRSPLRPITVRNSGVVSVFPSLHHRKEGWLRHQENIAKPPAKRKRDSAQPKEKPTQPGWFSTRIHRKTTPASRSADASRYFIDRSATPPCSDARRGLTLTPSQFLE